MVDCLVGKKKKKEKQKKNEMEAVRGNNHCRGKSDPGDPMSACLMMTTNLPSRSAARSTLYSTTRTPPESQRQSCWPTESHRTRCGDVCPPTHEHPAPSNTTAVAAQPNYALRFATPATVTMGLHTSQKRSDRTSPPPFLLLRDPSSH